MDDDFTPLPEHELGRRSDDQLVAYVRAAAAAGASGAVELGFELLVHGHRRRLRALIGRGLPADRVDDLLQETFLAAFDSIVAGKRIDAFAPWINKVARNTLADFWRGREGTQLKRDREAAPRDDEDAAPAPGPSVEGDFGLVEAWELIDGLLARRLPAHRAIVVLFVFQKRSAREVTDATGESADNVYKVAQRFRDDLHRLLHGEPPADNEPGSGREDRM